MLYLLERTYCYVIHFFMGNRTYSMRVFTAYFTHTLLTGLFGNRFPKQSAHCRSTRLCSYSKWLCCPYLSIVDRNVGILGITMSLSAKLYTQCVTLDFCVQHTYKQWFTWKIFLYSFYVYFFLCVFLNIRLCLLPISHLKTLSAIRYAINKARGNPHILLVNETDLERKEGPKSKAGLAGIPTDLQDTE